MGKRINIGVYIGPQDTDIAAWFNLLQENHMSRAKWVMALLCAYAMRQKLPIGTIDIHAPLVKASAPGNELLFGAGSSQAEVAKRDRYGYGWQIRGPHQEFIQGSVINVTVCKAEIMPILEESWKNGHRLATFLKALIRDNLEYGDHAAPPRIENQQKVVSAYFISQNSKKISNQVNTLYLRKGEEEAGKIEVATTQTSERGGAAPISPSPADTETNVSPAHPRRSSVRRPNLLKVPESSFPAQASLVDATASSSKMFRFEDEPNPHSAQIQPASAKSTAKNPLLSQI